MAMNVRKLSQLAGTAKKMIQASFESFEMDAFDWQASTSWRDLENPLNRLDADSLRVLPSGEDPALQDSASQFRHAKRLVCNSMQYDAVVDWILHFNNLARRISRLLADATRMKLVTSQLITLYVTCPSWTWRNHIRRANASPTPDAG